MSKTELANYKFATLVTMEGDVRFELLGDSAPKTVANFALLAKSDFYDGVSFHRVIADFMVQTGDPLSRDDDPSNDGSGGPGYQLEDEFNKKTPKLVRGMVAMANANEPNTNGSQFFIITADETAWLDGKHTPFGRVVEGMEMVDKISKAEIDENDHPQKDIIINDVIISRE
ncbi:hypothetical protein A2V68_01575 [candidate division Kazan bacterium RBG_13_50_9]|uniref:Peptidyl-prolyl cis-trans isomerase n=1 Tax=candidate division Kazan bacterium RBG_13_50_9 TaxID=1798535 RepID=A0A1F4NRD9_UNCK3|nr:MAG: hypothetical protein A2V68_01575 [candidate division Kazan bacterium RBG_13_50_9]